MNTRLKQFLAAENITQAQFADHINVVRASVSHVLSGRNNPSYEFIRSIMLKYPLLNIEWLMFGKGKMYKDSSYQEESLPSEIPALFTDNTDENPMQTLPQPVIQPQIEEEVKAEVIVNQRKVSKIIVLFDDGSYQEM